MKTDTADMEFRYACKGSLGVILPELFDILFSNMRVIAPEEFNDYEASFNEWYGNVAPAMQKAPRQIILMYIGKTLAGYFQYYINRQSSILMMEEIQIKREFQCTGLFEAFFRMLVKTLPRDICAAEAFAHRANTKSQGILEHLGLARCPEKENGDFYHYRGNYSNIVKKYGE